MKKPEKKKTGKKKAAAGNTNKLASKDLQRDFNKRMKILVRDIRKETQITIKNVLKEAKRKIHEGSEFVMNDVLNSIVTTVESAEAAVTGKKESKPKKGKKAKAKEESPVNDNQPNNSPNSNQADNSPANTNDNNEITAVAPKPVRDVETRPASQDKADTPTVAKKPATTRPRKVALTPAEPAPEETTTQAQE